jgi:hypothetical protein
MLCEKKIKNSYEISVKAIKSSVSLLSQIDVTALRMLLYTVKDFEEITIKEY